MKLSNLPWGARRKWLDRLLWGSRAFGLGVVQMRVYVLKDTPWGLQDWVTTCNSCTRETIGSEV